MALWRRKWLVTMAAALRGGSALCAIAGNAWDAELSILISNPAGLRCRSVAVGCSWAAPLGLKALVAPCQSRKIRAHTGHNIS